MDRIHLEPEVTSLSIEEEDMGYIGIPPKIFSSNIILEKQKAKESLPANVEQYMNKYDFYFASFNIVAGVDRKSKGAKWILTKGILSTTDNDTIAVDDVGPSTKWSEGNKRLDVGIKVDFNKLSGIFEFFPIGDVNPVGGSLDFTYSKNPKIAEIITGGSGSNLEWQFTASKDQFVDGNHQVYFTFRTVKEVKEIYLDITEARAEYDYSFGRDIMRYKGQPHRIEVEIPRDING